MKNLRTEMRPILYCLSISISLQLTEGAFKGGLLSN